MSEIKYVAGVCNIGLEEIKRRRVVGWAGLIISLLLFVFLLWSEVSPWWRLFIFFPATVSAFGFLQAYFHFCSGFARRGVFNFNSPGKMTEVNDETSKVKDKKMGDQIIFYGIIIGALVALILTLS